jgi:hypothetical protein
MLIGPMVPKGGVFQTPKGPRPLMASDGVGWRHIASNGVASRLMASDGVGLRLIASDYV